MPRHKSTNPEAEISYAKMGPLTEKENYIFFKLTSWI
jgi:hypothetical protein